MTSTLIVGAGPTGLAAALFLTDRGIPVRIVEKQMYPSPYSRAFGINPRTLTLLEPTGVADQLLAHGQRMSALTVWQHHRRLFRLDLARVKHRFPFMLIYSQASTEAVLAQALQERGVQVERDIALEHVATDDEAARATLRHGDGLKEMVTATSLLGADGPHSTVRKTLGINFAGSAYTEPWHLYDLTLDTPLSPQEAHIFLLDDGGMFVVRLRDNVWRVLGSVPDLLDRLPHGTQVGQIEWESDFGISHRVAEQFQVGSAYLAGDAAHIHSGLGARGMNLGIEDAYVFAALVSEGRVQEYGRLRRPIVAAVMRKIERMTEVPRGQARWAKLVRTLIPVVAPILPTIAAPGRKFILGLDHEVRLR